ncbi:hypothetical protein [Paenibacillus sp. FSL R5-0908]|uniref:hypothetical protein n=1 Tax=Paenibacillus sp. FSL R5-0908 TaxID=2921664 RepID=UPI0030F89BDB
MRKPAYSPPVCECGEPLRAYVYIGNEVAFVLKTGRLAMRRINPNGGTVRHLYCRQARCSKTYYPYTDDKGRLHRGAEWRKGEQ